MAPPKRKTGGRTTPKGTRPGDKVGANEPRGAATSTGTHGAKGAKGSRIANPEENADGVHASRRYTPPVPEEMKHSAPWVPWLMLGLLILGAVLIVLRNMVFSGNNLLTLMGLGCILGGLFTATKWR